MHNGIEGDAALQASRVVPALPSDPRMRKLMKRQEDDQAKIPNQPGYDVIQVHRLDVNKNRLSAKGKRVQSVSSG
jgi:hypothetical protein